MAKSIFTSLKHSSSESGSSGIKSIGYYIPKENILTYPKVPEAPTTISESVTYEGDFVLKPDTFFASIYSTQGIGKVEVETIGEKDHKAIQNKLYFSYPQLNDEAKAFIKTNLNDSCLFIAAHYAKGAKPTYVVIGSEEHDTEVVTKGTSGSKAGDTKGITIDVTAGDFHALPVYTGLITLADGTLNCATGEFAATAEASA